ncbi:MAG: FKBP-type peptidyl-prolyl cis-trans isomerase [Bacteroidota bacterium]
MRSFHLFLILAGVICISACNNGKNPHKGYTKTDSGLNYKFIIDEPGESVKPGDRIVYHMSFRGGDTIVASSYDQGFPVDVRLPKGGDKDFEGNLLLQALSLMSKGDSLTYVRLIDSIPEGGRPPQFKSGDWIHFDISMKDTQTEADFMTAKAELLSTYNQTATGLYNKFLKDVEGPSPQPEEGVKYHLRMKKHELTVFSTYETNRPNGFQLPPAEELDQALSDNPIMEALTLMNVGDSLSIAFESDSLSGALRPEWGFQPGDLVIMDLTISEIQSKEEIEEQRSVMEKLRKQQEEEQLKAMEANEANARKIDAQVQAAIEKFKAGTLETTTTESGLKYHILEKGTGDKLKNGDRIFVDYSGHLMDGSRFDASFAKGTPFQLTLGTGGVIRGWDEGLALMNAGDKGYLFIPPNLGYGETGSPPRIPGNSDLVFYVEILDNTK